jgi:hypothetical protein
MKAILIGIGFILLFSCVKCGHTDWQERKNIRVQLKGVVLNQNHTLQIGDTIKISITIPDSVKVTDLKQNISTFHSVDYIEGGDVCFLKIWKIDTLKKQINAIKNDEIEIISVFGISPSGCYSFNKNSKPFTCFINLKLKSQGIYEINSIPPDANIKINGKIKGTTAISLDINRKEENWRMLAKYLNFVRAEEESMTIFKEKELEGGGIYGFRVE